MIRKITSTLGVRNLLVLGLVGSLALGGATVAFADDRDEPIVNRRDEQLDTDVDARDDDDLDDGNTGDAVTGATGATGATGITGASFDRGTLASVSASPSAAPAQLDTGDATRSNDGTIGGDTTAAAAPPAPPAPLDTGDATRSNDGTIGGDTTAAAAPPPPVNDDSNDADSVSGGESADSGDSGDDSDD
jgi:hypothetical protein